MNANQGRIVAGIHRPAFLLWVAVVATTGCAGGSNSPPSNEALLAIENVGKWFQLYRADNTGKPPSDEEAFLTFVNRKLSERGQETVDREKLLTSPRDGEPYVVLYGKINSGNQESNLVAYEKTGAYGTKLIVTELGRSRVVEDSDLQTILSGN